MREPKDYRWSSCGLFVDSPNKKSFVDQTFILGLLDQDVNRASQIYSELLKKAMEVKIERPFKNVRTLESFRRGLFGEISEIALRRKGNILTDEQELTKKIEELRVKGRLRNPQDRQAREFLIQQLLSRGYSAKEIAERLGMSRQAVYEALNLTKGVR